MEFYETAIFYFCLITFESQSRLQTTQDLKRSQFKLIRPSHELEVVGLAQLDITDKESLSPQLNLLSAGQRERV